MQKDPLARYYQKNKDGLHKRARKKYEYLFEEKE